MAASTNYDANYRRASLMNIVTINGTQYLDTLTFKYTNIVTQITAWTTYVYKGEQLTTIAYNVYGTTTLWWLILMFNGYFSPMQIQNGDTLRIPDSGQVNTYLNTKTISVGKTVVF